MQTPQALRAVDDPVWGPVKKLLFRFAFAYLVLYSFPFNATITGPGSGDSTYGYVQVFCFLGIAVAATVIWTLLDRKRRNYARLYDGLRVYVRFVLAVHMIEYGTSKVFPSQFPAPTTDRLMQPYGNASPMGLLWVFMGASVPYSVFTGLGELAGGLLLTIRRTALLGALVCVGLMSNMVMLNLGYDVPVKLFSAHLLLMAVFLAAHDLRRVTNALVLNRPAEPEEIRPLFRRKRLARTAAAGTAVFILSMTAMMLSGSYRDAQKYGPKAAPGLPLYGMWNVEELVVDGEVRPPLLTDQKRWRRLFFNTPGRLAIQLMSDSREPYDLELDEKKRTLALSRHDDPAWKTTLLYRRPQPDVLLVAGPFEGHQVRARLRLTEPPEFILVTRGFHWINERAFNR